MPRQLPRIKTSTYRLAHECSLQLWHGIDYSTGANQTSDAALLQNWAGHFQRALIKNISTRFKLIDLKKLIHTAKLSHYIGINEKIKTQLNVCLSTGIKPLYGQKNIGSNDYSENLGTGLAKRLGVGAKIVVASRILFYTIPDRCTFNLNEKVAEKLQMNGHPVKFVTPLVVEIHNKLNTDWKKLEKFKMPYKSAEISEEIWQLACDAGWWQRRVLDIAILLELGIANATYTINCINNKQKPTKC